VLEAAGLVDLRPDASELMALSGRAFHLAIDDVCSPAGPTAYDWDAEHTAAFERIGVLAD